MADHHRHLVRGQRRPAHHQSCLDLVYADPARRVNGRGTLNAAQEASGLAFAVRLPLAATHGERSCIATAYGCFTFAPLIAIHSKKPSIGTMQRRLRYASRNIGSRSTVSALALIGGGFGFSLHQYGIKPPPSSLTSRLASARKALLIMPDRNQRRSLEISRKHLEQDVHHRRVSPVEDRVVDVSRLKEDRRRRSADAYWEKWLAAASLRPDLQRLAMQSFRLRSDLKHGAAGVPSLSALPARCRRPSG